MLLFKRCLHTDQGFLCLFNNFAFISMPVCLVGIQDYRQCHAEQGAQVGRQGLRIFERVNDNGHEVDSDSATLF